MAVSIRDLRVLEQDLAALSAEVEQLGNSPDIQSKTKASDRIRRVRVDLEKLAASVEDSESPGPIVEMADRVIEPVEDLLSERPITTIAFGFGLGCALGFAWKR